MEAKPFILAEAGFRIFGYRQAVPDLREPPALARDFIVLMMADAMNMDVAMRATGKTLCVTVQNSVNSPVKNQFDCFRLS